MQYSRQVPLSSIHISAVQRDDGSRCCRYKYARS